MTTNIARATPVRLGLALGDGFARGIAHAGVLRVAKLTQRANVSERRWLASFHFASAPVQGVACVSGSANQARGRPGRVA